MIKIPKIILLIESSRAFGRGLLDGIIQYSTLSGSWLFYMKPELYIPDKKKSHKWLKTMGADGLIAHTRDKDLIDSIVDSGIPSIICGLDKPRRNAYCMFTNEFAVGRMAAEYFVKRGFKKFAYCGLDDMIWSQQKYQGFKTTLARYGFVPYTYRHSTTTKHSHKNNREQIHITEWLQSLPKPVALMACNDERGIDVLTACKTAGLKVPEQIAILGVDNDELICNFSQPPLSSIALSTKGAGYLAASVLNKLIKGQKIESHEKEIIIHPLHIVSRQSTNLLPIEDPEVAEAIDFIHKNCREKLQVKDVANAVAISRRALEQRFRKVLSRSVHEEIKNCRVNLMANMLIGTNLTLSQIARQFGYPDTSNISHYFKQKKGMSPLEYRKKFAPK